MKTVKKASKPLNPLILNLVNSTVETKHYPTKLKISKILPNIKPGKDQTNSEGWHPINLVPSLSKPIERTMLDQIVEFLIKKQFNKRKPSWKSKRILNPNTYYRNY